MMTSENSMANPETAGELYVSRFTSWAPGLSSAEDWQDWAAGKRDIPESEDCPGLLFTDPLFRRRLSQLSRMTIQVVHDLLPFSDQNKLIFLSFRGEIHRQLKINRMLIETGSIMPAAFSLSVFNAPAAMATIALNLSAGYSAVYVEESRFYAGVQAAAAPILGGGAEEAVLVYADELVPPEYQGLGPEKNSPFAFAAILSPIKTAGSLPVRLSPAWPPLGSPERFLRYLYGL
jgi:hypothetical protein